MFGVSSALNLDKNRLKIKREINKNVVGDFITDKSFDRYINQSYTNYEIKKGESQYSHRPGTSHDYSYSSTVLADCTG